MDHGGAGPGATGWRLAHAALVNAQLHARAIDEAQKPGVHALREILMRLNGGPQALDQVIVNGLYAQHRVGIAHGERADAQRLTGNVQIVLRGALRPAQGDLAGSEARAAHGDVHLLIIAQFEGQQITARFHAHHREPGELAAAHKAGKAARAVTALPGFAAVGIEDAVAKVHIRASGRFHDQHLITAHAAPSIGDAADIPRPELQALADAVEEDEIVSGPVHLGKWDSHTPLIAVRRAGRRTATRAGGARRAAGHSAFRALERHGTPRRRP